MDIGGAPLFREHGQQMAALCWRPANGAIEVLLITSLHNRRWILPKGWPVAGLSLADSAAREALEEAGVTGAVAAAPIGTYHYLKEKKDGGAMPCSVTVFALEVTGQQDDWPEKGARDMAWLAPDLAAQRVAEPGLRQIFAGFTPLRPRAARRAG